MSKRTKFNLSLTAFILVFSFWYIKLPSESKTINIDKVTGENKKIIDNAYKDFKNRVQIKGATYPKSNDTTWAYSLWLDSPYGKHSGIKISAQSTYLQNAESDLLEYIHENIKNQNLIK